MAWPITTPSSRSWAATKSTIGRGAATVDGVARGVPLFNIANAIVYRKDVFEELGLAALQHLGRVSRGRQSLKNNNLPVGQTLGHTFGDAPTFAYPLMWSFGGMEVDEIREVVINSKVPTRRWRS